MNKVITISREFGSGGRTVGKLVAEKLGIPCYDQEIIEKIASRHYRVHFGYMNMNGGMKGMKDMGLEQKNQKFDMECSLETTVRLSLVDTFLERIGDVEGCNVEEI